MSESVTFSLSPYSSDLLQMVCGEMGQSLKLIEKSLKVSIAQRGNAFNITGDAQAAIVAQQVIDVLYHLVDQHQKPLSGQDVYLVINRLQSQDGTVGENIVNSTLHSNEPDDKPMQPSAKKKSTRKNAISKADMLGNADEPMRIQLRKMTIEGQNRRQQQYLRAIYEHDITFGVGPAGTGKTYLAVACAVQALAENRVERILLVRPAVEAGERLGFLPGDIGQKIDPYLRPLFDALYEMLGFDRVGKLISRGVIELAPLAYMRGRTLNDAFVILDEAQNTTREQMKMFLTRIGFGSKAIITGDMTQIDLPRGQSSGLKHATYLLNNVKGIAICRFQPQDVVRHPLVQKIVEAYESHAEQLEQSQMQSAEDNRVVKTPDSDAQR